MPQRGIEEFIAHWTAASPSERANSQAFLLELCDLLEVPAPDNHPAHGYFFEYPVTEHHADGSTTTGRIDLYKRGCFVLESKQFQEARAEKSRLERAAEDAGVTTAKKSSQPVRGTGAWDDAMIKARGQAERYVRALPADNPPFLLVVDVGHTFEVFADFTQAGKAYLPFPDPRTFRLRLEQLRDDKVRERLRLIWTQPAALDPAKHSADVTREVSAHLAELAKSLESAGHASDVVAQFLTRCLFCMFAEDVQLLPKDSFRELLESLPADGAGFAELVQQLFREMNTGTGAGISVVLRKKLLQFNGGLFADDTVLPLNGLQLGLLKNAARQRWASVEPAIFGTLLERALNPAERHQLGAHYTPRAYVERLVLPTVVEPLRAEWENIRAAAVTHARAGNLKQARAEVNAFHDRLCKVTVLDPACGSGNFLYVALEHLKRLEGEVLDVAAAFGESFRLELQHHTVDPHQFLGLELNPRAAAIAELVLWIGYLQWHFRTRGATMPEEPVLRKFRNIECRDAVLAYDGEPQPVTWAMAAANPDLPGLPDEVRAEVRRTRSADWQSAVSPTVSRPNAAITPPVKTSPPAATATPGGLPTRDTAASSLRNPQPSTLNSQPITVWDRRSLKTDPVTGRQVPDETKRVPLLAYANPRPAVWPAADFIVGNPPFIGKGRLREDLGDGYAETLRATYPEVPESADFVLYWWHKAAGLVRAGRSQRFGFITTNSLRQTFARRVVQMHLGAPSIARPGPADDLPANDRPSAGKKPGLQPAPASSPSQLSTQIPLNPLSLVFAIPDHPWVDTAEGAAVRIAMTVGVAGEHPGELLEVTDEQPQDDGSEIVSFSSLQGKISADLTIGVNVAAAVPLKSNEGVCFQGMNLVGEGFRLTSEEAANLGHSAKTPVAVIRRYQKGRELVQGGSSGLVIDAYGFTEDKLRAEWPAAYQHLLTTVKPERDLNRDPARRAKWWLFGRSNEQLRKSLSGQPRYIATIETSKFKPFVFVEPDVVPDHKLYAITLADAFFLGVLSSHIHQVWAVASGGTLEDRPTWTNTTCFLPFPFPLCGEAEKERIRQLAEELDAHRKRVQAQHGLTLTGLYNVLEKLRAIDGARLCRSDQPQHTRTEKVAVHPPALPAGVTAAAGLADTAALPQLTPKEKLIHDQGLVSVLKQLHDDLDAAVFAAYGWHDLASMVGQGSRRAPLNAPSKAPPGRNPSAPSSLQAVDQGSAGASPYRDLDQEILTRLVALNAERAAEEARGVIHWLRPEYQTRSQKPGAGSQKELGLPETKARPKKIPQSAVRTPKLDWPKSLADRVKAVETALHAAAGPVLPADLAKRFKRAKSADLAEILETLVTLGRAHRQGDQFAR